MWLVHKRFSWVRRPRAQWWKRRLALLVVVGVVLVGCGGEKELVRQDLSVIDPNRCGGVSTVSCSGYKRDESYLQLTPTANPAP